MQDALRNDREQDIKSRTIHYHSLVHRLVAAYFCRPKSPKHTVVGDLDYDKMNNHPDNLKWMTPEENYKHQQSSPHVIKKNRRLMTRSVNPRTIKKHLKLNQHC